jgi:hypothetical protein
MTGNIRTLTFFGAPQVGEPLDLSLRSTAYKPLPVQPFSRPPPPDPKCKHYVGGTLWRHAKLQDGRFRYMCKICRHTMVFPKEPYDCE